MLYGVFDSRHCALQLCGNKTFEHVADALILSRE